jgi:hypothetical protein
MFASRFAHFPFGGIVATAFALAMLPSAGYGCTPEEQQACSGDAFRLCGADIPDVDRITACMIRNKSQLSPGCREFFRAGPEPETAPGAAAPIDIKPAAARKSVAKPHKIKNRPKPAAT